MSIKYDFYETNEVNGEEGKLRAKVVSQGTISTERLARYISKTSGISAAQAAGFIMMLTDSIVDFLKDGYDVQVGDLGYFSVSVTSRLLDSRKEIRAESVKFNRVNFRAASGLRKKFRRVKMELADARHRRVPVPAVDVENRIGKLKAYLDSNLCITRNDYSKLTGLKKNAAINELNGFIRDGWLRKYGTGRGVVYLINNKQG